MTPNQRTKLFMNLREHLKAANLQFFERATERQFLMMMRADEMTFAQLVTVRPDGVSIRVETKIPLVVPVHRRLAGAELVTRLNRVTERGHYDLDIDSGDMIFRVDAHALGSELMPGLLVRLLAMALQPVVRDWPVLDGVLARDEDSKDAIMRNAERIARVHEARKRTEDAAEKRPRRRPTRGRKDLPPEVLRDIDKLLGEHGLLGGTGDAPPAGDAGTQAIPESPATPETPGTPEPGAEAPPPDAPRPRKPSPEPRSPEDSAE